MATRLAFTASLALLLGALALITAAFAAPGAAQTSSTGPTATTTTTTDPEPSTSSTTTTTSQATTTPDSGAYAGQVEVVPGSIALSNSRPQPGDEVTVYVRIRNTSAATIQADCDILVTEATLPGQAWPDHQEVRLGPREERVVDRRWIAPADGRYEVQVIAKHVSAPSPSPVTHPFFVGGTDSAPQLLLTAGLTNIGNVERGESRTVPVDVTAYNADYDDVRLDVLEQGGLDVQVLTPPTDVRAGQTVQFFLRLSADSQENATPAESRRILLQANSTTGTSNVESINVVLHERGFLGIPFLSAPVAVASVGVGAALAATFRRHA